MRRLIICTFLLSLPAWGAWIEIYLWVGFFSVSQRRSPHGERGLKFLSWVRRNSHKMSLPAWGAWIEMPSAKTVEYQKISRSPHGERGLK